MIRIARPEPAPQVLLDAGQQETQFNCERYDAHDAAYRSGEEKFDFNRNIYAAETVKNALLRAQHDKCCYCESKFRANSPGAVEHFRPKRAVKSGLGASMVYPGYYWLAYDWNNLLVSCETCNTSHKGSLFPLVDEDARARCHHDDVDGETPVLVDPASENPVQHMLFRRAEIVHLSDRGRRNIECLGLRRAELEEARATRLEPLATLLEFLHDVTPDSSGAGPAAHVDKARKQLRESIRPEAEFSAMMRDFLSSHAGTIASA